MKILITGGTGFIGTALSKKLLQLGHELIIFTRRPDSISHCQACSDLSEISDDTEIDAIINLAGEPIADKAWTDERKQSLLASRVGVTQQLGQLMARLNSPPKHFISGSAVGIYGSRASEQLTEQTTLDVAEDDFAQQLCLQWEEAARKACPAATRLCIVRLGLVIGSGGGFLQPMLLPFKWGLGSRLSKGQQWMSWIHLNDVINAIVYLLENTAYEGVFNLTAPSPVTNHQFTQALAKQLERPAVFFAPAFMLKLILGEARAGLLLSSQRVVPQRLENKSYRFSYSALPAALEAVLAES